MGVPNAPNATCTACTGCAVGWVGKTCSSWDPAAMPQLLAALRKVGAQATAAQRSLRAREHILPGSIGWGANIVTGQLAQLPVVKLSYTTDKVWGPNKVPAEAVLTPNQDPGAIVAPYSLPSLAALEELRGEWTAQNEGRTGYLFGGAPPVPLNLSEAYAQRFVYGLSYTAVQATFAQFTLELPQAPTQFACELDDFARTMIASLPPVYNKTTKPAFDAFIGFYGTSFTSASTNGGVAESVYGYQSWLLTQRAVGNPTAAEGPILPFAPSDILRYAQDDFYTDTGLKAPTFNPGSPASDYETNRPDRITTCFGGSPSQQCGGLPWQDSIRANPIPIEWTYSGIDQLITDDPALSGAVYDAIQAWIKDENEAWAATDVCPYGDVDRASGDPCHHRGSCDKSRHVSVCTCGAEVVPWETRENPNKTWVRSMGNACSQCFQGWGMPATPGKLSPCDRPICNPPCQNKRASGGFCTLPNYCACCPVCPGKNYNSNRHCKTDGGAPIAGCTAWSSKNSTPWKCLECKFQPRADQPDGPPGCCGTCWPDPQCGT